MRAIPLIPGRLYRLTFRGHSLDMIACDGLHAITLGLHLVRTRSVPLGGAMTLEELNKVNSELKGWRNTPRSTKRPPPCSPLCAMGKRRWRMRSGDRPHNLHRRQ